MRAAALSHIRNSLRAVQQPQAPCEQSRLEKLPADVLGVAVGFLGFHSLAAASRVSKTLYELPDLTAARARHRLTLKAMPHGQGGERDLLDRSRATEYLSLGSATTTVVDYGFQRLAPVVGPRALVCRERDYDSVVDFFSPRYSRCVLRTKSDQGSFYTFIVDINKATGEVLIFDHPKPDDYYTRPHPQEMRTDFEELLQGLDLDTLTPLERYEAAGVFIGTTTGFSPAFPHAPEFGYSILLQLPVRDHTKPDYEYVYIGDRCRHFFPPEPLTRFFGRLNNNHSNQEVALSRNFMYFPKFNSMGVVSYTARAAAWRYTPLPREVRHYGDAVHNQGIWGGGHNEGLWESAQLWDIRHGWSRVIPQTIRRHGGSRWYPDRPNLLPEFKYTRTRRVDPAMFPNDTPPPSHLTYRQV